MNGETYRRIDEIFERALDLPATERGAFLEVACAGDAGVRQAVEELLAADLEAARGFLEVPALDATELPAGTRIGPYRIERPLGRGGMGEVYLARHEDVDRLVALKLVDRPFRHAELIARFHAERQILARLEHPAIARLYDAGQTSEGIPFLVLEYVDGEPLDEYCNRRRLGLAARLELFRQLLDGVAHAHQNLLVHRDIKPNNVLVTTEGPVKGQVKLLDFGIAKRLDTPASSASLTRARPMTPAYASPEQVRGEPLTTATDVYSLGVVLYELLVGRSPYRLTSELPHELDAAILEQEPEKPSAAIDRPNAVPGAAQIAADRAMGPVELRRTLRGDLDTIALTALRKDPARRYRSVLELQADLEGWREDRPILARPDTVGYRLGKFLRRHRAGAAAGVLGLAVGTGLVVSLFAQRDRATRERDRAQAALGFVVGVFASEKPYQQGSREITAREILAAASRRAESELSSDPDLQAALYRALGQATAGIGRYEDASPLLDRSLAYDRRVHPESPEYAASLEAMGWLEFLRGDGEAALGHLEEAVALRRRTAPQSLPLAQALNLLGNVESELARTTDEATTARIESRFEEALELSRRIEGPNGPGVTANLSGLVKTVHSRGDLPRAEALAREVLAADLARYGPDHAETASSRRSLGLMLMDQAKFAEAEPLFRQALATLEKILPPDHPEIATGLADLGLLLGRAGRHDEAEPHFRRAYDLTRRQLGEDHRDTVISLGNLAMCLQGQGRLAEAIPLRERELVAEMRLHGEDSVMVAQTLGSLARALAEVGQLPRAEELARRSLAIQEHKLAPDHPDLAWPHRSLGMVLAAAGKFSEAEGHLRTSLEILRRTQAPDFFQTARVEVLLGSCLTHLGRLDEAGSLIDHGRAMLEAKFPPEHERVREARAKSDELARARAGA